MEKRDLRSVLSFFAEIASSMRQEENRITSDDAEEGKDLPQQAVEGSWAPSGAR